MELPARSSRLLILGVLAVAALSLWGRLAAPSDLWDQTQPRTLAYTADMLARGGSAWILAVDAEGLPATKPPLVNWLAAPAVALFGRAHELGHRLPSIVAAVAVVVLLVRVGERIGRGIGWLAALGWIASYATFKLFALVRPDMLLCALLVIGWLAAMRALATPEQEQPPEDRRGSPAAALTFWSAAILAGWTKGPVAILLPAFAIALSLSLHRSLAPLRSLRPLMGLAAFLLLAPAWYVAASLVGPQHVKTILLGEELVGRVTGLGEEGSKRGPMAILVDLPLMPFYFVSRFAPWSIAAILGMLALSARLADGRRRWRTVNEGTLLLGAIVWILLVVVAFSLSSGKRADYLAPALPPAALLAAWWLLEDRFSPTRGGRPVAIAALVLAASVFVGLFTFREFRGAVFDGETVRRFDEIVRRTKEAKERDRTMIVVHPQLPHVAILLGDPPPRDNTFEGLRARLDRGESLRALLADPWHDAEIAALLARGDARILFSIEHGPDALKKGYASPVRLVEFLGGEANVVPGLAGTPRAPGQAREFME